MYENVLVPVDGSDPALAAVEHAARLATVHDAQLHLLHVVDTGAVVESASVDVLGAMEEAGERALENAREVAAEAGAESIEASIAQGVPHRAIVDSVDQLDADVVVMGTHGRTGLERFLLGSVTEKVVRLSPVPVTTVGPAADVAE